VFCGVLWGVLRCRKLEVCIYSHWILLILVTSISLHLRSLILLQKQSRSRFAHLVSMKLSVRSDLIVLPLQRYRPNFSAPLLLDLLEFIFAFLFIDNLYRFKTEERHHPHSFRSSSLSECLYAAGCSGCAMHSLPNHGARTCHPQVSFTTAVRY
jgi:hypothetical protein